MLKGIGRVESSLMYSMYSLLLANFHSVSASPCMNKYTRVNIIGSLVTYACASVFMCVYKSFVLFTHLSMCVCVYVRV